MYHHATKEKLPELVVEFLARFSHPEYFQNPQNYLKAAILPLAYPSKKVVQKSSKFAQPYCPKTNSKSSYFCSILIKLPQDSILTKSKNLVKSISVKV